MRIRRCIAPRKRSPPYAAGQDGAGFVAREVGEEGVAFALERRVEGGGVGGAHQGARVAEGARGERGEGGCGLAP